MEWTLAWAIVLMPVPGDGGVTEWCNRAYEAIHHRDGPSYREETRGHTLHEGLTCKAAGDNGRCLAIRM